MARGSAGIEAAELRGVEALRVTVEVSTSGGIPGIDIVGMPDSAVLEARSGRAGSISPGRASPSISRRAR